MSAEGSRRFELPEGLTASEERAVIAALERYFAPEHGEPDPWSFAGRAHATAQGALQTRKFAPGAWRRGGGGFARRGHPTLLGRGDSR